MERDSLMHRTVEQQVSAFAFVNDHTKQRYLIQQWTEFLDHTQRQSAGQLTAFIGHMQRAEPTSIFVPKRSFRSLSPGNPYASAASDGDYEEVHPKTIMLRLLSCREQLADDWLKLVPELAALTQLIEDKDVEAPVSAAAAVGSSGEGSRDRQLLFGIATKVAARQMLAELKCRPSCKHLHEWLVSYLLVQHANDLTAQGSVERLHADLRAQPVSIRGDALVDPFGISREIFGRSGVILEHIEQDLLIAPSHVTDVTSSFLNTCLAL